MGLLPHFVYPGDIKYNNIMMDSSPLHKSLSIPPIQTELEIILKWRDPDIELCIQSNTT